MQHETHKLPIKFTLSFPERQQALRAYMAVHGPNYTELAKKMGLAVATVCEYCRRASIPPTQVEKMKECGIPEHLLPEPVYVKPGPKPIRKFDVDEGQDGLDA